MNIPIVSQRLTSFGNTFKSLFHISQMVESTPEKEIVLDFTDADFLNIVYATGLHCLISQWKRKGKTLKYVYPQSSLHDYLEAICFEDGVVLPEEHALKRFEKLSTEENYLPITYIPCYGERVNDTPVFDYVWNKVVDAVKKVLNTPPREYWQIFPYFFEELGNNVQDHSGAEYCVFSFQCYPSENLIQVVIADSGKGIFKSYAQSPNFNPAVELEAFDFAMQGKSAKDRPKAESRGFGISTSRDILVNGTEGNYALWSGKTVYVEGPNFDRGLFTTEHAFPNALFDGCINILQIPLRDHLLIDFNKATSKA